MQSLVNTCDRTSRYIKCLCANNLTRVFVGNTQYHIPTTFISEGDTITNQFLEIVVVLGLFELKVLIFGRNK